jgi:hypothetical protein
VLEHIRIARIHCELEVEGDHVALRGNGNAAAPREVRLGEVFDAGGSRLQLAEATVATPAPSLGPPWTTSRSRSFARRTTSRRYWTKPRSRRRSQRCASACSASTAPTRASPSFCPNRES